MISTDFAPNEGWDDAWLSFKLLFQPWKWKHGKERELVKNKILRHFKFQISNFKFRAFLFLTARSALFTILKALQLPKDSEVIVQAFTCEAVILPILANGLKPVYVDIETKSFSIDPIDLQKKITNKSKVIILQHSFSMTPAYRDHVLSLIKEHNLLLIEDIAHGYSIEKYQISNIKDQKLTFLMSFGRSKALSSVFGGAVITSNKELQNKLGQYEASLLMPSMIFILRLLLYKPISVLIKSTYDLFIGKLVHRIINFLHLVPTEITAKEKRGEYDPLLDKAYPNGLAILLSHQLDKYEQMLKNRALICSLYSNKLKNVTRYTLHVTRNPLLRYPILVNNPDLIRQKAVKQNIYLGLWYNQVVGPKSIDLTKMQYQKSSCPNAENICKKILNLPTNISYHEALRIIKMLATTLY